MLGVSDDAETLQESSVSQEEALTQKEKEILVQEDEDDDEATFDIRDEFSLSLYQTFFRTKKRQNIILM
jgi:hypothetical protein